MAARKICTNWHSFQAQRESSQRTADAFSRSDDQMVRVPATRWASSRRAAPANSIGAARLAQRRQIARRRVHWSSFDDLVGAGEQRRRNFNPERARRR
jgi:hypothetical protein